MKKQLKSLSQKLPVLEKRLAGYGVMSMAIAAAVAPNAGASVIYWTSDVTTPVAGGIYFDLVSGSVSTVSSNSLIPGSAPGRFALENFVGSLGFLKASMIASATNRFAVVRSASASSSSVPTSAARLALNTVIGPALNFQALGNQVYPSLGGNNDFPFGQWNALGKDFIGLTFTTGSQTNYGWAQITINPDYTITLNAMAYENSGESIVAAEAAPEPSSMMLLALGAAGLAAYRRKRSAGASVPTATA